MSLASQGNQMNIHECAIDLKHGEDGEEDIYQNFPDEFVFYFLEKARLKSRGKLYLNITQQHIIIMYIRSMMHSVL